MKKTYRKVTFECQAYEDIMNVYYSNYVDEYQLIGYQMHKISELHWKACLILFSRKEKRNESI